MKLKELLRDITVLETTADPETEIADIRYDSRAVERGDLFIAVEGYASDGHRFIPMAAQRGAAAVLCVKKPACDIPYILTDDTRKALALVSAAYFGYPARRLCMIGVTGTNGKTTVTTLIKHILEDCLGTKVGLIGTVANFIGEREYPSARTTPESYDLQRLLRDMADAGCTHAVMEVSSHALFLDRTAGVRFKAGVFTNLTQDHLDFHKSMLAYAEAKSRLFSACDAGAVNTDDMWSTFMAQKAACPTLSYGTGGAEELAASDIECSAAGVRFTAALGSQKCGVRLSIPGRFSVQNALAAMAAGAIMEIPLDKMAEALARVRGVKGRAEIVPTPEDFTVVIDYAHTPDALEKILMTMKGIAPGRVVAVFGCGGDRDAKKRPIMGRMAYENADFTVVTSDNPRTEDPSGIIEDIVEGFPKNAPMIVIPDRREAIAWAIDHRQKGDVIVLAGKGHETYQEINGVKYHMDEREIVAAHLAGGKE